jgi:hypothetical protein
MDTIVTADALWTWGALFGLGVFHGVNPGMGWLFAVALGLQEQRGRAVARAMLPLALGHAAAIGVAVLAAALAGRAIPQDVLQRVVGIGLLSLGAYRVWRCRHPRWGGMTVGARDLAVWSFLMASAHGAGLMVVPLVIGMGSASATPLPNPHAHHAIAAAEGPQADALLHALTATTIHGLGYLVVTAAIAWVVYRYLGVGLLRKAWVNLDLVWAAALATTGAVALSLAG